jgi:O-antigen/teichoic acid export membrane protein
MLIKSANLKLKSLFTKSEDLGRERYRKAMLTSLMNVFSQAVQLATGLISIPLTLNYVGIERFGIWMTLSTALVFITFSDFGVGIGLQDRMSKFIGSENLDAARRVFFSSFLFILILLIALIITSHVLVPHIDFSSFLSLKSKEAIEDVAPTTEMVIFILGLGLLAGLVQRAFNALQEGFWVALIQVFARILSLVLLFVVVNMKLGLPALVFVVGGLFGVALLIIGLPLLLIRHRWILPSIGMWVKNLDFICLKDVLKIGTLGLGASVAIYFVNNSIPFLIAYKYGAENVADYAVLLKLLSIPGFFLTYLLLPLWPAISEAKVKGDIGWIKKTYCRCSTLVLILTIISAIFFMSFGRQVILLWTQNEAVVPSVNLLLASIIFMILGFWNSLTSVMLNGLSKYKGQATYGTILAVLFVYIAWIFPFSYGKEYIVWIIAVGYLLRCVMMQLEVSRYLKSV